MPLNALNIVQRLNDIVTGDRYLAERELDILAAVRVAASGIPVGAATAPTATTAGISFANGETALLHFDVPQDYAENKDQIALRLHVVPSADAADTTDIGITTAQSIYRAGAAVDATVSDAVAEDATASTGALVREVVLDISGRGYKPGDHVILTLDVNGSGATELVLVGADLIYGSVLAAYNRDDRERVLGS